MLCRRLFLCLTFSLPTYAKWSTEADLPLKILSRTKIITVDKDGTSETIEEERAKVLNEQGRDHLTSFTTPYHEPCILKILEAKTIVNEKVYPIEEDDIKDKTLFGFKTAFDAWRQTMLSFKNLEIGCEVFLKSYLKEIAPVNGFFSKMVQLGSEEWCDTSTTTITSEQPLHYVVNDPEGALEVTYNEEDHQLVIHQKKPLCHRTTGYEPGPLAHADQTCVYVSTLQKWEEIAAKHCPLYEKVIEQELPSVLDDILAKAKEGKTEEEQINLVTSVLNQKIVYMGDLRSIKGMQYPRDLKEVCDAQQADCKEFSSCTAAILRKMGYQAYPALVRRCEQLLSFEDDLPSTYAFNHVMLKVITPTQKTLWIDPTNFESMADGIFPDIEGKKVLVLHPEAPSYETIPLIDPKQAVISSTRTIALLPNGKIRYEGSLLYKKECALPLIGLQLKISDETIKQDLFHALSGGDIESITSMDIQLPDLTSRIVEDKKINFSFTSEDSLKSNCGSGVYLSADNIEKIIASVEGQVTMLPLGHPNTNERTYILQGIQPLNIRSLNCCYTSPWADVTRECRYEGEDTWITDTVVTKTPFITREELESETYKELKEGLIRNFMKTCIIFPNDAETAEGTVQEKGRKARNSLSE